MTVNVKARKTPSFVGWGWGALIVLTGVGYYYAKGENEKRWKGARARGLRAIENPEDAAATTTSTTTSSKA
ncbi:uncharacterized protein LOC62_07G009366 [Vanrija pseudolonga]|uniref:Uncharacterized protein n=1 Tax=Vanrija pseudolonga TaxID=143232 RepID=A0AAF0YFH0_9TREE|nr:hypothetical protein LOC62_07G009366 [Vanrija pseudolonga]